LTSYEKKHEEARMLWDKQKSIIPLSGVHLTIKLKKMGEKREKTWEIIQIIGSLKRE